MSWGSRSWRTTCCGARESPPSRRHEWDPVLALLASRSECQHGADNDAAWGTSRTGVDFRCLSAKCGERPWTVLNIVAISSRKHPAYLAESSPVSP